jgi:hypothetical protein
MGTNPTASDGTHHDEGPERAARTRLVRLDRRTEAPAAPEPPAPTTPIPRPRSRGETILLWTFGILDLLIDMVSEPIELARERVRLLRRMSEE